MDLEGPSGRFVPSERNGEVGRLQLCVMAPGSGSNSDVRTEQPRW